MDKKNKRFALVTSLLISSLLTACGSEQVKPESANHEQVTSESVEAEKKAPKSDAKIAQVEELKPMQQNTTPFPAPKTSMLINGVKMTLTSATLKAGDTVFDQSVQQNAEVTGKVVVVLKKGEKLPSGWKAEYVVERIADRTYSLVAKMQNNVLATYTMLSKSSIVETAELGLFYGGDNAKETM
jgi:hypothetical protein